MRTTFYGLLAAGLLAFTIVAQAAPSPFKTTYDELLEEFPNFQAQLKDVPPVSEGNKRRGGSIKVGTGLLLLEAEGKYLDKLEVFSCGMILTKETTAGDTNTLDELCNSFVRKLARTEKAYWQVRPYMAEEFKRQLTVLSAGGTPKASNRTFGNTRLSVRVDAANGIMTISYSFMRLG